MKITVVCDVLGEENNGTTIAAMNLIRFLQKNGHEVKIICADQNKKNVAGYYVVSNLSFGKLLDSYVDKIGVTIAKANISIIEEAIKDADIIHIMLPFSLGMATTKLALDKKIPVTAGFHMMAQSLTTYLKLDIPFVNTAVYKYIYKNFYSKVNAIHYPTLFVRNIFENEVKKRTNGYIISNGVDESIKKIEIDKPLEFKDKIIILSIGRYSKEKGHTTLIKSIKRSKYENKIQLIIAGQGLKIKEYKKIAKNMTNLPIFKFYSRTQLLNIINYCDIYVHPANVELEGISCLEAITCGKLTIVSDSKFAATKDFAIDNKCIFKHNNYIDLSTKIDYFIENPIEKEKYEKLYFESSSKYNQNECMNKMVEMFETTITNNK